MEIKTKHRILGILVLAGLIVIIMPFFQSGKDISPDTAMINSPPFPDQSVQMTDNTIPVVKEEKTAPVVAPPTAEPTTQSLPIVQKTVDEIIQQPDRISDSDTVAKEPTVETVEPAKPNTVEMPGSLENAPSTDAKIATSEKVDALSNPVSDAITPTNQVNEQVVPVPVDNKIASTTSTTHAKTKEKKLAGKSKKTLTASAKQKMGKRTSYVHLPIDNNGLANLNNSAWVIQVGSFKNKANALRVVNRLRANGYRAFIQQISTDAGKNTRVFVGPENKQKIASALADELKKEMHVEGIVISYQPLAS